MTVTLEIEFRFYTTGIRHNPRYHGPVSRRFCCQYTTISGLSSVISGFIHFYLRGKGSIIIPFLTCLQNESRRFKFYDVANILSSNFIIILPLLTLPHRTNGDPSTPDLSSGTRTEVKVEAV